MAILQSSRLCGELDLTMMNLSVFVTVRRLSPIVISKGISPKGQEYSSEKPASGVFESTRRDLIDGFNFNKCGESSDTLAFSLFDAMKCQVRLREPLLQAKIILEGICKHVTGHRHYPFFHANGSFRVQTSGSGISYLLAVATTFTGSGNLYCQWEHLTWQWECLVHFIPNTFISIDVGYGSGVEKLDGFDRIEEFLGCLRDCQVVTPRQRWKHRNAT
uniref:Uncharacterized protein n=1 Tax=Tanacetum cinerariifolium TaxID=118510 RepID=A0A6L2JC27_TANCI|nr:hypothetical protein [Tanacetum cinerariifolium]